jgi:hypothetical protein
VEGKSRKRRNRPGRLKTVVIIIAGNDYPRAGEYRVTRRMLTSSRRLRPEQMTGEEALEQARAFARAERDRR